MDIDVDPPGQKFTDVLIGEAGPLPACSRSGKGDWRESGRMMEVRCREIPLQVIVRYLVGER